MRLSLAVFFLLCTLYETYASSYRAAVVDYSPIYQKGQVSRAEALQIMNENLDAYETFILQAKGNASNIILFPEDGLYGAYFYTRDEIRPYLEVIPDVDPQNTTQPAIIPCQYSLIQKEESPILTRASCFAQKYQITLVLNMGEVRHCFSSDPHCPSDLRYQFNTLVAFSSTGQLVAKYHKSHLYYEPQFDEPPYPAPVWFESDFGVRFGMLICFDMMFEEPQLSLYRDHGIRDFLWSSWWVNEPPLITGTQVELARSLSLPSNFLASGIGLSWYNSGSGIYSYGKALAHWYNFGDTPRSKLLIADLPMFSEMQSVETIPLLPVLDTTPIAPATPPTIQTFVATPGVYQTVSSTSNNLTCTAKVLVSEGNGGGDWYGVYSLQGIYNGLFPAQICALSRCSDQQCTGYTLETFSKFSYFEISGSFDMDKLFMMYPLVASNHSTVAAPAVYTTDSLRFPSVLHKNMGDPFPLLNAALFGLEYHELHNNSDTDLL